MRLLALLEDGRPVDLDREVAAEHEVGQDRVGRGPQLLGREAGPRGRLRAALLEARPTAGVRNGRIAIATMTIAVASAVSSEATRPAAGFTGQS